MIVVKVREQLSPDELAVQLRTHSNHQLAKRWNCSEKVFRTLRRQLGIPSPYAVEVGIHREASSASTLAETLPASPRVEPEVKPAPTLEERAQTLREKQASILERKIEDERTHRQATLEALREMVVGNTPSLGQSDLFPPAPKPSASRHQPQEVNVMWSDHHIGETVDPAHTGGIGGFSWAIYQQRMLVWEQKVRGIISMHQQTHPVRHMNVFMLGDMVTGQLIYLGQEGYVDQHIGKQVVEGAAFLAGLLTRLLGLVDTIDVYAVPGNHGRTGPKKMALPPAANFDWLFTEFLRAWVRDEPRVHIDNSEATYMVVERPGADFLLMHGDNIRSWNTIPWYGAERHVRRMRELLDVRARYVLAGHMHVSASWDQANGSCIFGGSVLGPTDFTVNKMGVGSLPCQTLFFTHPEHGKTAEYPIYLATWDEIRHVDIRGQHRA